MLFDPFEKQFYQPSLAIEIGNRQWGNAEIVSQENVVLVLID